jgi:hypothetical protein
LNHYRFGWSRAGVTPDDGDLLRYPISGFRVSKSRPNGQVGEACECPLRTSRGFAGHIGNLVKLISEKREHASEDRSPHSGFVEKEKVVDVLKHIFLFCLSIVLVIAVIVSIWHGLESGRIVYLALAAILSYL